MKILAAAFLALLAIPAWAVQISGVTGASNVIVSDTYGYNVYYSNITDNLDVTGLNYIGDPKGAACSKILNPNCKIAGDTLTISAKVTAPTSGSPMIYLVYSQTLPSAGSAVGSLTQIITGRPFIRGQNVDFNLTWGDLCSKVSASEAAIGGLGTNCENTDILNMPHSFTLYVVADNNGSGVVGSDVTPLYFNFNSTIPRYTGSGLGVYDFKATAMSAGVSFTNLMADQSFPGFTNFVGVSTVRFYYTAVANSAFDSANFANIDPEANAPYFETGVDIHGTLATSTFSGLTSGQTYYFRTAVVDNAGNVGLLSNTDTQDHMIMVP